MKRQILIALTALWLCACSEETGNPVLPAYRDNAKTALVILVENNDGLIGGIYETAFNNYHNETLKIFSELFDVPFDTIEKMTLNDIIENYGEDWQINSIREAGKDYYDTIIAYRNEQCTEMNFKNTLLSLSEQDYVIDMVFCLHGSKSTFSLYDKSCSVAEFTGYLKKNNIRIRALYQTCCYGSYVIGEWQKFGIHALNGSAGLNSITMFSPAYFVEEWTKGNTFEKSVYTAYNKEIETVKSYNKYIPVIEYILTGENLLESRQSIGGINPGLLWKNFPELFFFSFNCSNNAISQFRINTSINHIDFIFSKIPGLLGRLFEI